MTHTEMIQRIADELLATGQQPNRTRATAAAYREMEREIHDRDHADADNTLDGWPLLPGEGLLGPARR